MTALVTHRSKKDYVVASLRRDILDGVLAPGARLIIDDLASSYGVSPIPVREALQQLQSDGYVVIQPYAGAKVAEIEIDAIHEIFALLESLEVISGRAACERMGEEDHPGAQPDRALRLRRPPLPRRPAPAERRRHEHDPRRSAMTA